MTNRLVSVDSLSYLFPSAVMGAVGDQFQFGRAVSVNPSMSQAAIQTVLSGVTSGSRVAFAPGTYSLTSALSVAIAGTSIDLTGATLQQTVDLTPAITIADTAGVSIRGGKFLGKGTDWVNSSSVYGATAIQISGTSDDANVTGVTVSGYAGVGVRVMKSGGGFTPKRVVISACKIVGPGHPPIVDTTSNFGAGILIDDGADDCLVTGCAISQWAQGVVGGDCDSIRISNNHIFNIVGQHGIYLGSVREFAAHGNQIEDTGLEGIKLQIGHSGTSVDAEDIVIVGNSITRCGSHGIHVTNVTTELTQRSRRVIISDNTVYCNTAAGDGIRYIYGADGIIEGNRVSGGRNGIVIQNVAGLTMTGNRAISASQRGIFITDSTDLDLSHNRVQDPATANTVSTNYGIDIQGSASTRITLLNNTVNDTGSHMKYGLNIGAGTQATMRFRGNRFTGATDYGANLQSGIRPMEWHQNTCAGLLGAMLTVYGSSSLTGMNMLLGEAFDPAFATISQAVWTAGTLFVVKVPLDGGGAIKNIWYQISAAGATLTASQNFVGVYDSNLNLLQSSADQSGVWNSTGNKQTTLSTATSEQSGFVYVAFLWNGTTSPQIRGVNGSGMGTIGTVSSPDFRFATGGTSLTTLPGTLPTLTAATTAPWVGLS